MPSPGPEAARLAERYRLAFARAPVRGAPGDRLARSTGSSLELHDRRAYAVGDDPRHLDWRAYARTDQLQVRRYRAELAPRVDLVVDASRSMAVEDAKAALAVDLACLLGACARAGGHDVVVHVLRERPERIDQGELFGRGLELDATGDGAATLSAAAAMLRPGSLRIIVSDFLFPHDAAALVRPLARSGGLALVQVLGPSDARPEEGAMLRLVDAESSSGADLVLDRRTLEAYRQRLARLGAALERECARAGAAFASVVAERTLDDLCRGELVPAGILAPA